MSAKANERDPNTELVLKAIGNSWVEIEDLNDDFVNNSLGFTPNDNFTLWDKIEDIYDDELIEGLSPDDFFKEDEVTENSNNSMPYYKLFD